MVRVLTQNVRGIEFDPHWEHLSFSVIRDVQGENLIIFIINSNNLFILTVAGSTLLLMT